MQKYQTYYLEMVSQNKNLFNDFKNIHDLYTKDQEKWQTKYNEVGAKVLEIIKKWEGKLCSMTENGGYNKFSGGLAEKFWKEIRKNYQYIDFVGVK